MPYASPMADPTDPATQLKARLRSRLGDPNSALTSEGPLTPSGPLTGDQRPPSHPSPPGSPVTIGTDLPAPAGVIGPQNQSYQGQIPQPTVKSPGSSYAGPAATTNQQEDSPRVTTEPVVTPTLNPTDPTSGNPESGGPSLTTVTGTPTSTAPAGWPDVTGIDPRLQALYQKYGRTPTGQGSGLTDWAYWNQKIQSGDAGYFLGRLESDLAGTGPDQGGGGQAPATQSAPSATSPFTDQIRALLMQRLQRDLSPTSETDPAIAQPFGAAQLAAQRSTEQERKQLAEAQYAQAARGGGAVDSGALTQGIQQSNERNAVGLAGVKGQLFSRVIQSKIDDLNAGMSQALASGDAETARLFQGYIAQLQAELTREGYGVTLAGIENQQNTNPFSVVG